MRVVTEIQADGPPNPTPARAERTSSKKPRNKNETHPALPESSAAQSQEYSALVARATNDAVRDWNVNTGALAWPQGLQPLLGHIASAETSEIGFWQKQIHPQDRAHTAASIRDALAAESDHWAGEYRFRRADGRYLDVFERALIVRNSDGTATRFVGALMDITTRKQVQDQLCRSQKMEAFGQLAGNVAHDFNNFLTTILGYSDLLLDELGMKGVVADHIAEIRKAAGRASALTAQLLAFCRRNPLAPQVLDVNSLIANFERSLLRLLGEDVTVQCHLSAEKNGTHTKVDSSQLTQIMLNLVVNARDAMPNGGQLTIGTSAVSSVDTNTNNMPRELPEGEYVVITVQDNGVGMSEEVKRHLFEPFFTTKNDGRGSGLGLATSYGIVRQSGGYISIESELGRGTTVYIYLPRVPAPPPPSYKRPGANRLPTGSETVLVLEDDISVRHISVRLLRGLGYDVLEAANGDDAQRLIGELEGKTVDLLLTDMVMPQMSGRRFADWLRHTNPHTKVIFISGYLEESIHPLDRREEGMFFLPKPFDSEQLARKVREALDSAKATR